MRQLPAAMGKKHFITITCIINFKFRYNKIKIYFTINILLPLPSGKLTMSLYEIPACRSVSCQISHIYMISILCVLRSSFTLSIHVFLCLPLLPLPVV